MDDSGALAAQAEQIRTDLARLVGAVSIAGITIDAEVYQAVALLTSWSSWIQDLAHTWHTHE